MPVNEGAKGVSGAHARAEATVAGDPARAKATRETVERTMRTPVEVKYHTIRYPNDKLKVVKTAYYAVDGSKDPIKKTSVACVLKKGRLLSGRIPDGYKP